MAFPTSSLTNNQVHKEGNRAFVYDSALGVWDQVRETDRTENKIIQGEIGSGVAFPAGHAVQVKKNIMNGQNTNAGTGWTWVSDLSTTITPVLDNSSMLITAHWSVYNSTTSATHYFDIYRNSSSLTKTYNLSGDDRGILLMVADGEWTPCAISWFDDTSAMTSRGDKNVITYGVSMRVSAGTGVLNNSSSSQIVVTEVAV